MNGFQRALRNLSRIDHLLVMGKLRFDSVQTIDWVELNLGFKYHSFLKPISRLQIENAAHYLGTSNRH